MKGEDEMDCLLSDHQIEESRSTKRLIIEPFSGQLEPASYDLRAGCRIISITRAFDKELTEEGVTIQPGELFMVESLEKVGFSPELSGRICSKVSLLSKGLSSIATKIDPGYGFPEGLNLLLVFKHLGHAPLVLKKGQAICSMEIEKLDSPASKSYPKKQAPTMTLERIELNDPLGNMTDFRKVEKENVEKFHGHPIDDLVLAVGQLQNRCDTIQKLVPAKIELIALVYILYILSFVTIGLAITLFSPTIWNLLSLGVFVSIVSIGTVIIRHFLDLRFKGD